MKNAGLPLVNKRFASAIFDMLQYSLYLVFPGQA